MGRIRPIQSDYRDQRPVNQHSAAVMIVDQLQKKTRTQIRLYAGDPAYGEPHKEAFRTWSWPSAPADITFNIVSTAYDKHETFTLVDDNTLVLAILVVDAEVMTICSEYARPVAIIGQADRKGPDGARTPWVNKDQYWYEVEHDDKKHAIPGPGRGV